mmetsp:Transcript_23213/g.34270  ORF Transcript_23213/g.34270 Transcript_23213/m.34270 type:complete len:211 (-) Transcript_23213:2011-2643(-)
MFHLRVLRSVTGGSHEEANEGRASWNFAVLYELLAIIFLIVILLFITRVIFVYVNRRRNEIAIQELKDVVEKRDKFIKERLPVSKWNEGDTEKECSICMEDFVPGARVSRSVVGETKNDKEGGCQHMYHTNCIEAWLMKHHECPICRGTFLGSKESEVFIKRGSSLAEMPSISQSGPVSSNGSDRHSNNERNDINAGSNDGNLSEDGFSV